VRFEQGSKLTRIDQWAFMDCRSLRSFFIPGQLEILASGIFECESLSELMFETPSRMRQLHLPMDDFVSLSIPDSVKILTGVLQAVNRHDRRLQFGPESRLVKIRLIRSIKPCANGSTVGRRDVPEGLTVFVCLSEGTLRGLRCSFEGF
jgi:hypothetical protein